MHIPCGCTLTTQDFVVYPDDTECQTGLEVEAKQGVNMAMAYAFNLTVPQGSLVSLTTNTSYCFLLPSLRQLYGNNSLTLDAGVPLKELAADISTRMRELKEKANSGTFSNIYNAAVAIMDPIVWIWFTILSMMVGINLIFLVNNGRKVRALMIAGTLGSRATHALAYSIDVTNFSPSPATPLEVETDMNFLDNILAWAASTFCIYLLIKLVRYGWKKRSICCAKRSPQGFMDSPPGMKVLMKVGTPMDNYTLCLHEFMTQMDDETFFKVASAT